MFWLVFVKVRWLECKGPVEKVSHDNGWLPTLGSTGGGYVDFARSCILVSNLFLLMPAILTQSQAPSSISIRIAG